jgi:DNA-binding NtrC family response regulator
MGRARHNADRKPGSERRARTIEAGVKEQARILLVEDHASFRQALAFMFEREPGFAEIRQAGSVEEARGALDGWTSLLWTSGCRMAMGRA